MQDYDFEKIWQRLTKKLDLNKLKKTTTDKQRFKLFKKLFDRSDQAKNLQKMKADNKKKLYEFALADLSIKRTKTVQESLKRFSLPRKQRIKQAKQQIKKTSEIQNKTTFNKKGRRIVSKGQKIKIGQKTYKGGQFIPKQN